jgi:hypothetical protein
MILTISDGSIKNQAATTGSSSDDSQNKKLNFFQ